MNIIVTNKYKELINSANIDVMKELNGEFKISDLANNINSIFYKKLIIDATAISGFPKSDVLKELSQVFDTEKLILFLPPDNPPPKNFLSFLVSLNIYNFTDNVKGLLELVKKSNNYDSVKDYVVVDKPSVNNQNNELDLNFSSSLADATGRIILGIKNVTKDSGSTSLCYMLTKSLNEVHKKPTFALEVNKNNFMYYNYNNLYSIESTRLKDFFSSLSNFDILILDLDDDNNINSEICNDIIYLVDPSLYKINELLMGDRMAFSRLKGKKVILYNSLLSDSDIRTFAREAGISIYFALPPLNDRVLNPILNELLAKLGLIEEVSGKNSKRGLFDFFK